MKTSEKVELPVAIRTSGKHFSRGYRMKEQVPAVIYGPKMENMNLLIEEKLIKKYVSSKFESTIFNLKSENGKLNNQAVLLKKIQVHPVSNRPLHVDFYAVDMTAAIRVNVTIKFEGKAIGTADGGMVQIQMRDVEIECLPNDIPEFIVCDVTNLGVGDAFHVSDLQTPAGVKIVTLGHFTVATVAVLGDETPAAAAAATAAPAAAAAPAAGAKAAPAAAAAPKKDAKK